MPVSNPVINTAALAAGVRDNFIRTYDDTYEASREMLSLVMEMGVPSLSRTTTEVYHETAPYPEHWAYGTNIPHGNFRAISYQVVARRYAKRVSWNEDDRKDDQTGNVIKRARSMGTNFGTAHERAFFDLLQGTTNFIPIVPNAPDGVGFFSATDGTGANRFQVAGGNIVTGNGVSEVSQIQQDYYTTLSRFPSFLNTEGELLIGEEIIDRGVLLIVGVANREIFERAFNQMTVQAINAGVSNVVKDANRKVRIWYTARITNDDWYVALTGHPLKGTAQYEHEALQMDDGNRGNSDFTRDSGEEYFQAYMRSGYSINLPYTMAQVNN